ncbi:Carbohydrate esterase family 5 protein [Mycena indigotica]|uniref:cutinase n=1 Tax=Mycena indigotica TaxID=2126181 RepID=A0A8H6SM19_9AGAR|nr:Carbohydrate esterase family 5 protein [Mycena indigotica]KAF7302113.1 Carbohydrate esterase family 5 protein [Mycena indigotica]
MPLYPSRQRQDREFLLGSRLDAILKTSIPRHNKVSIRQSFIMLFATVFLSLFFSLSSAAPVVISSRAACADVMVIFARGTTEPAPIGIVAGPPLQAALKAALKGRTLSFQGVDYPANIPGFLVGGDKQGSKTMADDLTQAADACPDAALVTVGYSQGGQLVHNSAKLLSEDVSKRVKAAVIFGDPDNGQAVAGIDAANTKVICHVGDNICQGGSLILPPHLTYGQDARSAAAFIASRV